MWRRSGPREYDAHDSHESDHSDDSDDSDEPDEPDEPDERAAIDFCGHNESCGPNKFCDLSESH